MTRARSLRKKIFRVLAVLWMAVIFAFSARNADLSTEDSHRAGRIAAELMVPGFDELTPEEQEQIILRLDHPVRKTAHMAEYTVLGFFLGGSFHEPFTAWGLGALYAVTDELHQIFVPGRSGQISDVAIDSIGVFLGIMVWLLAVRLGKGFVKQKK